MKYSNDSQYLKENNLQVRTMHFQNHNLNLSILYLAYVYIVGQ